MHSLRGLPGASPRRATLASSTGIEGDSMALAGPEELQTLHWCHMFEVGDIRSDPRESKPTVEE